MKMLMFLLYFVCRLSPQSALVSPDQYTQTLDSLSGSTFYTSALPSVVSLQYYSLYQLFPVYSVRANFPLYAIGSEVLFLGDNHYSESLLQFWKSFKFNAFVISGKMSGRYLFFKSLGNRSAYNFSLSVRYNISDNLNVFIGQNNIKTERNFFEPYTDYVLWYQLENSQLQFMYRKLEYAERLAFVVKQRLSVCTMVMGFNHRFSYWNLGIQLPLENYLFQYAYESVSTLGDKHGFHIAIFY